MNVYSWETTARYAFIKTRFALSIPYNHHIAPIITSIKYIPEYNRIEIEGTYAPIEKKEDNLPQKQNQMS
jgi:hypothetical protein